jgi:hypothetical protein
VSNPYPKPADFQPSTRGDGAAINPPAAVDLNSGCSYDAQADVVVPSRAPIFRRSTLGDSNAAASIVGDLVTGSPRNDQSVTPEFPPIEKVSDSARELPGREIEP